MTSSIPDTSEETRRSQRQQESQERGEFQEIRESLESEDSDEPVNEPYPQRVIPVREIEKICGIYEDDTHELLFGIKFKKTSTVEFVPLKIANVKYPQEVIAFYERRIFFMTDTGYIKWIKE